MKSYYISHYFDPKNAAPFLLLSFLGLVIVLAIVLITAKIQVHQKLNAADYSPRTIRQIHSRHRKREYNLVERFFEMVFCSTSILMFLSLYYIIDEKIPEGSPSISPVRTHFWTSARRTPAGCAAPIR